MAPNSLGGRRTRRLRTVGRGVRSSPPVARERVAQRAVLDLVAQPFSGVEDAHHRLRELLTVFERRGDRRAVFLAIYARMTGAVAAGIADGDFEDPDWVGGYLVSFADRYRGAVRRYESGRFDSLATPWHLAFAAAERERSLVVQDALLGVNAHINYDLALALVDVGLDGDRERKHRDHAQVIDVIAGLVDEAQATLAARDAGGLAALDGSLGRLDEGLTVFTIDECRDSAWRTAVAMHSRFRLRRRFARWLNATASTGAAHLILGTHASAAVHETLVDLERSAGDD
ncbi:MAG: DUF5995 family protein [Haloferacaceae archaeon]